MSGTNPHLHWTAVVTLAALLAPALASAQDTPEFTSSKRATAARVPSDSIRLDGQLTEEVWSSAPALTEFIQKEPDEGAPPTDRMEVRFAYDDEALYVGARMVSASRAVIQAPLGRRDDVRQSEYLLVSFDTYLDRRTAYTFGVTASGVRLDHYHPADDETRIDQEFDPVWEARSQITDRGWTTEMWIPFSQLRFNDRPVQVWGLNVQRWIPSRNEEVYWVLIPRTIQGWSSRFGELHGIEEISPSRRLELLPYLGGTTTASGDRDSADPFAGDLKRRVGMDLKMGLGPNLTLETTVNPDFGQVEADPAEVNLTAFETFFSERRPFFIEGSRLLSSRVVSNYYYSRRIGARPSGPAGGDFVEYPTDATILGAAKLSGRLQSGLSVAVLGAVTGEEHARTNDRGSLAVERVRVAPRSLYGVARLEQEFGPAASTASLMVTTVHRDLADGDPLAARLVRNALSVNGDSLLRFKGGEYELGLQGGLSYIDGDPAALLRVQRASVRYFQRPDADYVTLDPTRSRMVGAKGGVQLERRSGRHWLWSVRMDMESPELELNDLGQLRAGDGIQVATNVSFRETVPGRLFRAYSVGGGTTVEWNYGGDRQPGSLRLNSSVTWPNFWRTSLSGSFDIRSQDWRLTRGGPSMATPRGWRVNGSLSNSSASATRLERACQLRAQRGWRAGLQREREHLGETRTPLGAVSRAELSTRARDPAVCGCAGPHGARDLR